MQHWPPPSRYWTWHSIFKSIFIIICLVDAFSSQHFFNLHQFDLIYRFNKRVLKVETYCVCIAIDLLWLKYRINATRHLKHLCEEEKRHKQQATSNRLVYFKRAFSRMMNSIFFSLFFCVFFLLSLSIDYIECYII